MNKDKELEKAIKNVSEIVDLCEDDIKNNNNNVTATLGLEDLKSLQIVLRELKDSIPKKKVKDKIKKLRRLQFKSTDLVAPWEANQGIINSLQELLEEK